MYSLLVVSVITFYDLQDIYIHDPHLATSRIHVMDPAVLRPGRFDEHIHVQIPDAEVRKKVMTTYTTTTLNVCSFIKQRLQIIDGLGKKMPTLLAEEERQQLSQMTQGWTGEKMGERERALIQEVDMVWIL